MDKPNPKIGRPPTPPEEKLIARTIRFKQSHWDEIDKYGVGWLRDFIERFIKRANR